jgi:hypothetical protein
MQEESVPTPIENMPGLTPALAQKLIAANISTDRTTGRSCA